MKSVLKRLPIIALCLACVLGLAACASSQSASSSAASSASSESSASDTASSAAVSVSSEAATQTSSTDIALGEHVLVVYYSATGNTAQVAQTLASKLNAETFVIEPVQPYTEADLDYNDPESRASQENEDPSLRDVALVSTEVPNWDTYDSVFIGYPIWFGNAAWPMDTFVKANDFTGKNVIPFCTSGSSPIGDSATHLQGLTNGGTWAYGMRFDSNPTQEAIDAWIETFILDMNQ